MHGCGTFLSRIGSNKQSAEAASSTSPATEGIPNLVVAAINNKDDQFVKVGDGGSPVP
jgi:hypothetical protein